MASTLNKEERQLKHSNKEYSKNFHRMKKSSLKDEIKNEEKLESKRNNENHRTINRAAERDGLRLQTVPLLPNRKSTQPKKNISTNQRTHISFF